MRCAWLFSLPLLSSFQLAVQLAPFVPSNSAGCGLCFDSSRSTAQVLCLALLYLSRYGHHAGLPGTNIPSLLSAHSLAICWERSTPYTMTSCQATPMTPLYPGFRYMLIVDFLIWKNMLYGDFREIFYDL